MATVAYGSVPFSEQIRFFRSKRSVLTESYLDVFGAEHDRAFMVAGANRTDLLADFRTAIDKVIAEGATLEEFRRDFDRIVAEHGWDYKGGRNWRSRVIYETNLRQSYNAGRWQQLQQLKRVRPWWRYRHSDAVEHPRPIHESWNNKIWHCDDAVWQHIYPANGWGCQCYVEALSDRDMKRYGLEPSPPLELEMVDVIVGQRSPGGPRAVQTPKGVDPGFGYPPGRSLEGAPPPGAPRTPPSMAQLMERTAQTALEKTAKLPALPAAQSAEQLLALPRARAAIDAGYAQWQKEILALRQARNRAYVVGSLDTNTVGSLQAAGIEPVTSAIVARDAEVLHALRDSKSALKAIATPRALAADELVRLPQLLREPVAILLDQVDQAVLYIAPASTRRETAKVVVALNYRLKTDAGKDVTNSFRTASLIDLVDLRAAVNRGELKILSGSLE